MSDRDPNAAPTTGELAESFFSAHDRCRAEVVRRLTEMRERGFRGFIDVGWFWPFAPLALHRSGKAKGGTSIRMTLFPVDERDASLPFGWVRYEIDAGKKIRVVARGDASQ